MDETLSEAEEMEVGNTPDQGAAERDFSTRELLQDLSGIDWANTATPPLGSPRKDLELPLASETSNMGMIILSETKNRKKSRMGAVSFRFFSETASAEGLASYVYRFLFLDLIPLLGGGATIIVDSTFLSRSCFSDICLPRFSSLKNNNVLNYFTSLIFIINFNPNSIIIILLIQGRGIFTWVGLSLLLWFPQTTHLP